MFVPDDEFDPTVDIVSSASAIYETNEAELITKIDDTLWEILS